ncbi:MAG: AAA family ATPase [Magnetococcus sp. DMHC-6]
MARNWQSLKLASLSSGLQKQEQEMYQKYFGLNRLPFDNTPDLQLFFSGAKRTEIMQTLIMAITSGEGLLKVIGDVGSGKTHLCRMLHNQLPKSVESVYMIHPPLSAESVLRTMGRELELNLPKTADRDDLLAALQDYLIHCLAQKKQLLLLVDEAQGIPIEVLEEIRLLTNLETGQQKLLQVILFGSPELDVKLALPAAQPLRERIGLSLYLPNFTHRDIALYLDHRLKQTGYLGPEIFSDSAIAEITFSSKGLVRRINMLAHKSMEIAESENIQRILPKHIWAAALECGFEIQKQEKGRYSYEWIHFFYHIRKKIAHKWWKIPVFSTAATLALVLMGSHSPYAQIKNSGQIAERQVNNGMNFSGIDIQFDYSLTLKKMQSIHQDVDFSKPLVFEKVIL